MAKRVTLRSYRSFSYLSGCFTAHAGTRTFIYTYRANIVYAIELCMFRYLNRTYYWLPITPLLLLWLVNSYYTVSQTIVLPFIYGSFEELGATFLSKNLIRHNIFFTNVNVMLTFFINIVAILLDLLTAKRTMYLFAHLGKFCSLQLGKLLEAQRLYYGETNSVFVRTVTETKSAIIQPVYIWYVYAYNHTHVHTPDVYIYNYYYCVVIVILLYNCRRNLQQFRSISSLY